MAINIIPKTREQLKSVINSNLGFNIPDRSICPGHCSPFDVVNDLYFELCDDVLIIANRNGGKTVIFAVVEYMESSTKARCESVHLGSVMSQAKRAYNYVSSWSNKRSHEIVKSNTEKTSFVNGSSIEILPGTMNAVNSPHPHKASIDEFELLKWEVFQEAISMPKSGDGIASSLRLATTRKFPSGNAQKMIMEADIRGFKLFKWCIFEVMSNCQALPGKQNCHRECKESFTYDKEGIKRYWVDVCEERGKRCVGYFSFEDVLKKFRTLDFEVFEAQWLCKKPEKQGACFSEFNEDVHVIDNISIEDIEEKYTPELGWEFGRGWDFGYDDPTAVGFYLFNRDIEVAIMVDEYIMSGELITIIGERIKERSKKYWPLLNQWEGHCVDWGDIAGKQTTGVDGNSYIGKLNAVNIKMNSQYLHIAAGIANVKDMLKINPNTEQPNFYICRRCRKTIEALQNAQWDRAKGDNEHSKEKYRHDKYSHTLDQIRYFISGAFDKGSDLDFWGGGAEDLSYNESNLKSIRQEINNENDTFQIINNLDDVDDVDFQFG